MESKEYILFIKINQYFLLLDRKLVEAQSTKDVSSEGKFFHEKNFEALKDREIVSREYLHEICTDGFSLESDKYLTSLSNFDNYCILIPLVKQTFFDRLFSRGKLHASLIEKGQRYAKYMGSKFLAKWHNELLNGLTRKNTDLKACVEAFRKYVFCDRYAFWLYNSRTKIFSCIANSHPLQKEYVNRKDTTSLYEFIEGRSTFEVRPPRRGCVNEKFAGKMETLNRIRLDLEGGEEVAIIDFLSKYPHFELWNETQNLIKYFLETKFFEHRKKSEVALHTVVQYLSSYKSGELTEFLYGLVEKICSQLRFQACSIFLKDPNNDFLKLEAVWDTKQSKKPQSEVIYDLKKASLTGSVYKSGKMKFSYDLANDPKNSHTYDEATESDPQNWIGVPLKSENRIWGALRVKNKHETGEKLHVINFTAGDCEALEVICAHLSSDLELEESHRQYVKKTENLQLKSNNLNRKIQNLGNFYKVFLHEIRTPIFTFGTSTKKMKVLLDNSSLGREENESITKKVDDIKTMAERLGYIADTYYFRELVRASERTRLFVLADIVWPVINISRDYIQKVHDVEIKVMESTLRGYSVYGDKRLLNMVFNALIDNAGKYSPYSRLPIQVSGEADKNVEYFYISVSNYGFEIHPEESEKIFDNGYQGIEVKKQKTGGTGIGLYMGKQIMRNQQGDLLLTSFCNPVTFKIKIPMKSGQKGESNGPHIINR